MYVCNMCMSVCTRVQLVAATGLSYKYYTYARSSERDMFNIVQLHNPCLSRARLRSIKSRQLARFFLRPLAHFLFSGSPKTRTCVSVFFRRPPPSHLSPMSHSARASSLGTMNGRARKGRFEMARMTAHLEPAAFLRSR